jgi:hypothetical protein
MLGVALSRTVQAAHSEQSFEQLQAMFEISPGILKLAGDVKKTLGDSTGRSRPLPPGTLIADAAGEIAVRSNYEAMPLQNLVSALNYGQGVTTASANLHADSTSWLAQRAVWWLPLE